MQNYYNIMKNSYIVYNLSSITTIGHFFNPPVEIQSYTLLTLVNKVIWMYYKV